MIRPLHLFLSFAIHLAVIGGLLLHEPTAPSDPDHDESERIEKEQPPKPSKPAINKVKLTVPAPPNMPTKKDAKQAAKNKKEEPPKTGKEAEKKPIPKSKSPDPQESARQPPQAKPPAPANRTPADADPPMGEIEYQAKRGSISAEQNPLALDPTSPPPIPTVSPEVPTPVSTALADSSRSIVSRLADRGAALATSDPSTSAIPDPMPRSKQAEPTRAQTTRPQPTLARSFGNAQFDRASGMQVPGFIIDPLDNTTIQRLIDQGDLLLAAGNGERNYRFSGPLGQPRTVRLDGSLHGFSSRSLTPARNVASAAASLLQREFTMHGEDLKAFHFWLLLSHHLDRIVLDGQRAAARSAQLPLAELSLTSGSLIRDSSGQLRYKVSQFATYP